MTSLKDVIAEALNSAHEDPGDEFDSLRKSYRHDGHKFNGACFVCRGDVAELAERIRTALVRERFMQLTLIAKLQEIANYYPAHIFTPDGKTSDGIAGTAIRERMLAEIRFLREDMPAARRVDADG
jgi:hypothetical protein